MDPTSIIKAFVDAEAPYREARQNQYKRLADLTRSATNAYVGLYGEWCQKDLFLKLHLNELDALARSNCQDEFSIAYDNWQGAIRINKLKSTVMCHEANLLYTIHMLETKGVLRRLLQHVRKWVVRYAIRSN